MNETEIADRINALTEQDWQESRSLYERVATHTGSFSEVRSGQKLPDGSVEMPHTIEAPIVREARQFFVDKHLQVAFDWSHWSEGRAMFEVDEANRFKNSSLEDTVKLFTAALRNDRFSEGAWAGLFENGDAARLLKRLLDFQPA